MSLKRTSYSLFLLICIVAIIFSNIFFKNNIIIHNSSAVAFSISESWSVSFDVGSVTSPSIADLDSDSFYEIVVCDGLGFIKCYEHSGGSPTWSFNTGNKMDSTPIIVDLDHDKKLDIIVGNHDGNLFCRF